MQNTKLQKMTAAAVLIAIGIIIPTFSPLKLVLEPASFTLASHVPIFLAMFISPSVAVAVAIGTTGGFFLGGFPLVIVLRAASHVIFAYFGAVFLRRYPAVLESPVKTQLFSFLLGVVHAGCEVAVSAVFYFGGDMSSAYYAKGFVVAILGLVGIGGIVHSMLDFAIALVVAYALRKQKTLHRLFPYKIGQKAR